MLALNKFHIDFEKKRIWENLSWMGMPALTNPFDLFIIQELIFKLKPDFVIETGTAHGGSALFYASVLESIGKGKVLTVDIENKLGLMNEDALRLFCNRIIPFTGDSVSRPIVDCIFDLAVGKKNLVILDSWHSKTHVLKELYSYCDLVPSGSYIIVEDTHVNNHPVPWKWGEGPYEAVQEFLAKNNDFEVDRDCEKLLFTFHPSGYLRKK